VGVSRRAVVALVFVGVALAGCSDDAPRDELAQAATRTREAETARFDLRSNLEIDVGGHQEEMEFGGDGEADFAAGRMAASMTSPMTGLELGHVVDGGVLYQQKQLPGQELLWVRQERARVPAVASLESTADPLALLEAVAAGEEKTEDLGVDTVDGEELEGRALSLPADELAGDAPGALSELTLDVEVWTDDEGRVRRLVQEFDLAEFFPAVEAVSAEVDELVIMQPMLAELAGLDDVAGTSTSVFEFTDFGSEVDITVPEEDVVSLQEYGEQLDELVSRLGA
jgi:hypothetical protein